MGIDERDRCIALTHGHTIIVEGLAQQGTPLEELPFRGAMYIRGHADNDSGLWSPWSSRGLRPLLGGIRRTRYLGRALRAEFGFER